MSKDRDEETAAGAPAPGCDQTVLMESATVTPGDGGEYLVSRGMPAISTEGQEVGWVAAVVMDARGASTAVLMARPRTMLEYYVLSPGLIERVNDGHLLLGIRAEATWSLPRRSTSSTL
jgi:hypothetical protein